MALNEPVFNKYDSDTIKEERPLRKYPLNHLFKQNKGKGYEAFAKLFEVIT